MSSRRITLSARSWLTVHDQWLVATQAHALFEELRRSLVWESRSIVLFGREMLQPRLIAWCGALPYRYSGQTLQPLPVPSHLQPILSRVNQTANAEFNHILLNRYRDGQDSMGLHADNEAELGASPVVATLSLGCPRRFLVRAKDRTVAWQEPLASGSLLVMHGDCQHEFKHELPKQKTVTEERLSLTFRRLLNPPR